MNTTITRYSRRNWAVYDTQGNLIAVTVYRQGATRVSELLAQIPGDPTLEKTGTLQGEINSAGYLQK